MAVQEAYQNKMQLIRMVDIFSEAIQKNPHNILALYYRGVALKRLGEYDAALRDFKAVGDLNSPYCANAWQEIKASQKPTYRKFGSNPEILLPLQDRAKTREHIMGDLYAAANKVSNVKFKSKL
jgi:tetratricopeptide (TPR) repeat protein